MNYQYIYEYVITYTIQSIVYNKFVKLRKVDNVK